MSEPAGIVMPFAGSVAPEGYLLCDGSAVSRTDYATLFEVIGTTYGAGDGSTTFNVPDLSGRVVIGVSGTHALASTGGSETVTLSTSELPAHSHEVPQHGHADNITATTPEFTHSITAQPTFTYDRPKSEGSTGGSSGSVYSGTSVTAATLYQPVQIAAHSPFACTTNGTIDNCDEFDSESTGGGGTHNNMQPFMAISYIISTGE